MIYSMGLESEQLVKQFNLSDEEFRDYELVLQKFDSHFTPQRNAIHKNFGDTKEDRLSVIV